jgi:hypothetical protein
MYNILQNQMIIKKASLDNQSQNQAMAGNVKPTQKGLGNLSQNTQYMTSMQKSGQRNG